MPRPAASLDTMPHSAIREMGALAARHPGAIRLEAGDPDFTTPEHIIEAAAAAARAGFTKDTPSGGPHEPARARRREGRETERARVRRRAGGRDHRRLRRPLHEPRLPARPRRRGARPRSRLGPPP